MKVRHFTGVHCRVDLSPSTVAQRPATKSSRIAERRQRRRSLATRKTPSEAACSYREIRMTGSTGICNSTRRSPSRLTARLRAYLPHLEANYQAVYVDGQSWTTTGGVGERHFSETDRSVARSESWDAVAGSNG